MTRKLFETIKRVVSAGPAPAWQSRPVTPTVAPARNVDRRREPRLPCLVDVTLTVLDEPGAVRAAHVVDCASRGLAVRVGAPVMVETEAGLLLGEACHCVAAGGRHRVGVALRQALASTAPLADLYARLGLAPRATPNTETGTPASPEPSPTGPPSPSRDQSGHRA